MSTNAMRIGVRAVLLALVAIGLPVPGTIDLAAADDIVVRSVPAATTDPAIDDPGVGNHHVVLGPAPARTGKLLVFFPGTGARPDQYSLFLRRAAQLGFHTIGLNYINTFSVNFDLCKRDSPPDCSADIRTEVLTGEDASTLVNVSPANSAYNRLVKLLAYLEVTYPGEGWGGYLSGGQPRWDLMTAAGQSQGGGHAAFTAKLHAVERAILLSATEPDDWTLAPGATAPLRYFGLVHRLEPISVGIIQSWNNLEMKGPDAYFDLVPVQPNNYRGSHRLVTTRVDCTGDPTSFGWAHNCPSVDGWMPLNPDGTSVYQPAWDYLMLQDPTA